MKVVTHGKCLRFTCQACQCVFQATKAERIVRFKDGGINAPQESGYYTVCPECGQKDVKGYAPWEENE